jgi:hypothetical protein
MDGVLADFDKKYEELFGVRPIDVKLRRKHFLNNWESLVKGENFIHLEKHKDADKLLTFVKTLNIPIEILSSSGGHHYHNEVAYQKLTWLNKNNIYFKANIVPSGCKKATYAHPWHILVDDTPSVINKYRAAGGVAILHYDIDVTINELSKLFLEWKSDAG